MSKKTKTIIMALSITFIISLLIATFIGMITNSLSNLDFLLVAVSFIGISNICKNIKEGKYDA